MQRAGSLLPSTLACLLVASPAGAYKIGSHLGRKSPGLHEQFTIAAQSCLDKAGGNLPTDCRDFVKVATGAARDRRALPTNMDSYAVRWPDDPTRLLDTIPGMIRFAGQLGLECPLVERSDPIDQTGLACGSHYGRLQFMHAQALTATEAPTTTRKKILAWAAFAFDAATDPAIRASNYCKTVQAQSEPALLDALGLASPEWCDDRPQRILGLKIGTYRAWTVRSLFALHCTSVTQEHRCWERTGQYGEESARAAARGALLHLIQDSYSQSHVARVPPAAHRPGPRGPFVAQIVCRAPALFYDYGAQSDGGQDDLANTPKDPHGKADLSPALNSSCTEKDHETDDLLTASAVTLFYLNSFEQAVQPRGPNLEPTT